ncbi:MAG TPA: hypothetical protein VK509_12675, partial [Polyangiales bacterium]|nr:hypothetical protein [Polyangiales bacterium]
FVRHAVVPEANTKTIELGLAALDSLRRLGGEAEKAGLGLARSAVAFRTASELPLPAGAKCPAPSSR